jgi:hypothetical protein
MLAALEPAPTDAPSASFGEAEVRQLLLASDLPVSDVRTLTPISPHPVRLRLVPLRARLSWQDARVGGDVLFEAWPSATQATVRVARPPKADVADHGRPQLLTEGWAVLILPAELDATATAGYQRWLRQLVKEHSPPSL